MYRWRLEHMSKPADIPELLIGCDFMQSELTSHHDGDRQRPKGRVVLVIWSGWSRLTALVVAAPERAWTGAFDFPFRPAARAGHAPGLALAG